MNPFESGSSGDIHTEKKPEFYLRSYSSGPSISPNLPDATSHHVKLSPPPLLILQTFLTGVGKGVEESGQPIICAVNEGGGSQYNVGSMQTHGRHKRITHQEK
uniref:Uncharacterized protein n=1 Tax=Schistocephalus solidus TaxID=70667 RepID=A0A0X3QBA3_SCHSO